MATETPVLDTERVVDELLADIGRLPPSLPPDGGGDDSGPSREPERRPVLENAVLGMLIFLAAETMLFSGLVAAFLVLSLGAPVWPPPFQPRLPIEVTGVNTLFLLASSVTLVRALRAIRRGDQAGLVRGLGQTALLGAIFLGVQGYEWARLVHFGLTASSGAYGATFYTLIGTHGFHVLVAVLVLLVVLVRAKRGRFSPQRHTAVRVSGMFWHYVVGLWPILYTLVYLR
jgi:heme/copper-type cytochrome/quinol oxidase subunit 3